MSHDEIPPVVVEHTKPMESKLVHLALAVLVTLLYGGLIAVGLR